MREQTFEFLKQLINSKRVGDTFLRSDLTNMLIRYYHPGPKDSKNATIRSTTNPVIHVFIKRGTVERIGRGKYKILKHFPVFLEYKDIKDEFKN